MTRPQQLKGSLRSKLEIGCPQVRLAKKGQKCPFGPIRPWRAEVVLGTGPLWSKSFTPASWARAHTERARASRFSIGQAPPGTADTGANLVATRLLLELRRGQYIPTTRPRPNLARAKRGPAMVWAQSQAKDQGAYYLKQHVKTRDLGCTLYSDRNQDKPESARSPRRSGVWPSQALRVLALTPFPCRGVRPRAPRNRPCSVQP